MKQTALFFLFLLCLATNAGAEPQRQKQNFNGNWLLHIGEQKGAETTSFDDHDWARVTLPRAWNEDEAFSKACAELSDTIVWYRKHFNVNPAEAQNCKFFVEFEGVRFGADFYLNGHHIGISENGVMACGVDLTPYICEGENVMAVRTDNSWNYHERATGSTFQWNNKNFNANYGGLPKNVWLHTTGRVYQTLPLYSNLGTTGTYIYGTNYDVAGHQVVVNAESEVQNDDSRTHAFLYTIEVFDAEGQRVARSEGDRCQLRAGERAVVKAHTQLNNAHFWSWGYGYLYTVRTSLVDEQGRAIDRVDTRTGFRHTRFAEGKTFLNGRALMVHGYAQRTSNEWPAVGMSVPAWLSDYSNRLMVESGANVVRWMHVTPWKQDVESCDRVGLIQAMPAGDAEKDVTGRRWEQRVELMRDAIIYNRNNPSILFYEGGNESISREHMMELKAVRDQYDPHGGRAIGSREMLDIAEAEYGGEMLYVNKSATHPLWQMEYCRDEGLRRYWDNWSYPYHQEGDGPLYRGKPAREYNHNMDEMAREMVVRWFDYYLERPGTGRRVNNGGVKIVFSDTNTHFRGEANYRTSGVVDAMRIPKESFFVHQVMWDGWVTPEHDRTYIVGHWNYETTATPSQTIPTTPSPTLPKGRESDAGGNQNSSLFTLHSSLKNNQNSSLFTLHSSLKKYVVSTGERVELFLNGRSLGFGKRSHQYLFTFDSLRYEPGQLEAVSYDRHGRELSRHSVETAGEPHHLKVTTIENPEGFRADGADMALVQFEVVDAEGRRCPLDNRMVNCHLWGEGEWRGGIAGPTTPKLPTTPTPALPKGRESNAGGNHTSNLSLNTSNLKNAELLDGPGVVSSAQNYILERSLPVEGGVNRVLVRSTTNPGTIWLTLAAEGLKPVTIEMHTQPADGHLPALTLPLNLTRGETPLTPSYTDVSQSAQVVAVKAGSNQNEAMNAIDDNELSEWKSDGNRQNAWITFCLKEKTMVDEVVLKLTGWRNKCYPIAVFAGKKKVWEGITYATLGYVHIPISKPVAAQELTIRMLAPVQDSNAFGDVKELAGGNAGELDRLKTTQGTVQLRIVEADLLWRCAK